jgi:hypothetical protein
MNTQFGSAKKAFEDGDKQNVPGWQISWKFELLYDCAK